MTHDAHPTDYPYRHIYERDDFTCQLCGWSGKEAFERWWVANFSVTHIKPPSHGGTDDDDNLVLSCHACAQHKGNVDCDTLDDARRIVEANRTHARTWYETHVE